MSRLFGPVRQLGYVVKDVERAMRHWVEVLGVGPWFYIERYPVSNFRYRGQPSDVHLSIALANSGTLQVELIQQRNTAPSMYRDFLAAGHEGLQHVSSWPVDYDLVLARALASGYRIGQTGDTSRGPFVYLETEAHPGTVMEMAVLSPTRRRVFEAVEQAAVDWDGTDPIRLSWPQ